MDPSLSPSLPPVTVEGDRPKNLLHITVGAKFESFFWELQPIHRCGFASGLGEFLNFLLIFTHQHFPFSKPGHFTRFSIKPKLDYLGFELETFT